MSRPCWVVCSILGSRAYQTHEVHFEQATAEARRDQMQAEYDAAPAMYPGTCIITDTKTGQRWDHSTPPTPVHVAFFVEAALAP